LLIINKPFQDRLRALIENFDKDAEGVTLPLNANGGKDCTASWGDEIFGFGNSPFTTVGTVEVSQSDLLVIALQTSLKCALWTTALDSKPLMDFVGSLKSVVHIA
jgi:hypothetical protein